MDEWQMYIGARMDADNARERRRFLKEQKKNNE